MIVRQFLHWVRTASPGHRAEATGALARAYLYSDMNADERVIAEGAMIMLLDDPSPLVRQALAQNLSSSAKAPHSVIHALASDQPDIAAIVLEQSPRLIDADLVEIIAAGEPSAQAAIARRMFVPCPVAAALAEVASAEACLLLLENPQAEIAVFSIERIVERYGQLAAIREALLARDDLPVPLRQMLVAKLADSLSRYVTARAWLRPDRAERIANEASEKATVAIAATADDEMRSLISHLRQTGQLTVGLILRALLSGNISLFEQALSELSELSLVRVRAVIDGGSRAAFAALYEQAGLPTSAYPAFYEAFEVLSDAEYLFGEPGGQGQLKRGMVERVLERCDRDRIDDTAPLLGLLRRFAAEAARDEARLYCDEVVAEDYVSSAEAA
jgi:uncharacterized protein (DUF2336 family)